MKKADSSSYPELLEQIEPVKEKCLYIYCNLLAKDAIHDHIDVWSESNHGKLTGIMVKYYDSFQIFGDADMIDVATAAEILREYSPKTISGNKEFIQKLEEYLTGYKTVYGIIVRMSDYRELPQFTKVEPARAEDANEIAELLRTDEDFYNNYTQEGLASQLRDRILNKTGRSWVIRENGHVAAHVATFAETNTFAIESGLVAAKEYIKMFYGAVLLEYMKKVLTLENKTAYSLRVMYYMQNATKVTGEEICGYYGKMTKC